VEILEESHCGINHSPEWGIPAVKVNLQGPPCGFAEPALNDHMRYLPPEVAQVRR